MNLNSCAFLIREAILNIRRNGLMSLAALGTITVALTVLGASAWTAYRVTEIAEEQPQKFNMIGMFLRDNIQRAGTLKVRQRVLALPEVRAVVLVPREAAWDALRHKEPTLADSLPTNPLMDRLDVVARDDGKVKALAAKLRDARLFPEVLQVNDASQEVSALLGFARVIRVIGFSTAIGLFVATLLIVQNTIRLTVLARRREIRLMQLVGATSAFIRFPLLLEGMFHGFAGGAIAYAILFGCAREVSRFVATLHSPLVGDVPTHLGNIHIFGGLVSAGIVVGTIGSYLALYRFLRQP